MSKLTKGPYILCAFELYEIRRGIDYNYTENVGGSILNANMKQGLCNYNRTHFDATHCHLFIH